MQCSESDSLSTKDIEEHSEEITRKSTSQANRFSAVHLTLSRGVKMARTTTNSDDGPESGGVGPMKMPLPSSSTQDEAGNVISSGLVSNSEFSPLHAATQTDSPLNSGKQQSTCQNNEISQPHALKVEDALSYVEQVKYMFENNLEVYNNFLDIMNEFKAQIIDTEGVIKRVSNLFKDHRDLIEGFNMFLPQGYKINMETSMSSNRDEVSPRPLGTSMYTVVFPPDHELSVCSVNSNSIKLVPNENILSCPDDQHFRQKCPDNTGALIESHVKHVSDDKSTAFAQPDSIDNTWLDFRVNSRDCREPKLHLPDSAKPMLESASDSPYYCCESEKQKQERENAIALISKVKNHFKHQPEKYRQFLNFIHLFVKEQHSLEGNDSTVSKRENELELYKKVSNLFGKEEDLLTEFSQFLTLNIKQEFLPLSMKSNTQSRNCRGDLTTEMNSVNSSFTHNYSDSFSKNYENERNNDLDKSKSQYPRSNTKRLHSLISMNNNGTPVKQSKTISFRDVSLAEASKFGSIYDHAFFDKVKRALKCQQVYENFLRCLMLYNQEIVNRSELVELVTPFLGKFPELFRWFKNILSYPGISVSLSEDNSFACKKSGITPLSESLMVQRKRSLGDFSADVSNNIPSRVGASYCALPRNYEHPKCTGRTTLCREVLNDTWVSFPSWSEGSTFVTSRKSLYEEYIHQCEDERFELDVVIETNASTIRVLEGVLKKLTRMTPKEVARFKLTDCLGGSSPTIHQRALKQIYGDKAADIIEGLKKKPQVAVPVVLRRLKAKEEEWRNAQKEFNKVWREQNEKYYLRSLDYQATNFKQNDMKALRSKTLFNEIETLYDERLEQMEGCDNHEEATNGPHLMLPYKNISVIDDAAELLIHHVTYQAGIIESDKQRMIKVLRDILNVMFSSKISEYEQKLTADKIQETKNEKCDFVNSTLKIPYLEQTSLNVSVNSNNVPTRSPNSMPRSDLSKENRGFHNSFTETTKKNLSMKQNIVNLNNNKNLTNKSRYSRPDESYSLFFGDNNWYLFIRLHHILCERLATIYERSIQNILDEPPNENGKKESVAAALRLKPRNEILRGLGLADYYPTFLKMVKNLLIGSMETMTYEDTLREMFGIHAYVAFTLDKVISHAVRQLVHLVTDDSCRKCSDLFQDMWKKGATGGLCATSHQRAAAELLYQKQAVNSLRGGNCYKIIAYQKSCEVTIELLDMEPDICLSPEVIQWHDYIDRFANDRGAHYETLSDVAAPKTNQNALTPHCVPLGVEHRYPKSKFVFLRRNVLSWWKKFGPAVKANLEAMTPKKLQKSHEETPDTERSSSGVHNIDKYFSKNKVNEPLTNVPTLITSDSTQCRFHFNKYHMMFVVHKNKFLYRRKSMGNARLVHPAISCRMHGRFNRWHSSWAKRHVSKSQQNACLRWLMGQNATTVHRTHAVSDNDVTRPPYRTYNRYCVGLK